ncbi:MAG: hypothetical protein UV33_C0047G0003 [Candidatus Daviesbacteria bacterium GW2011_GWA1_42_6]|uniref:Uncharacterized protein n=1 Tax=Candidatus Daviesbacteria bacterium GW2011_GWA1_42_6 TaxID=1618420 RepID=A0A0G1ARM8_9BACT|nr:MAG: hypothetical protein UV33_C0047G0003 [Candidatus Daviesbacteria bacterium GW2011_GWA1_42_6]
MNLCSVLSGKVFFQQFSNFSTNSSSILQNSILSLLIDPSDSKAPRIKARSSVSVEGNVATLVLPVLGLG